MLVKWRQRSWCVNRRARASTDEPASMEEPGPKSSTLAADQCRKRVPTYYAPVNHWNRQSQQQGVGVASLTEKVAEPHGDPSTNQMWKAANRLSVFLERSPALPRCQRSCGAPHPIDASRLPIHFNLPLDLSPRPINRSVAHSCSEN